MFFTNIDLVGTLKQRILRQDVGDTMRAMSKNETVEHANKCHLLKTDKCSHGE